MIGLTSLWIDGRPKVSPEINPRRAVFVLGKIDEILSWEKMKDQEKDVRFALDNLIKLCVDLPSKAASSSYFCSQRFLVT